MADKFLKLNLKDGTLGEATAAEFDHSETTHLCEPGEPCLLFSDGTKLRIGQDKSGHLILKLTK